MTITLTQCEDLILHTLDASELPGEIPYTDIVNRAGTWLYNAHAWSWLFKRGTLTGTVGLNYASLSSLGATQVENVWFANNLSRWARRTTLDHIVTIRAANVSNNEPVFWALGWRDLSNVMTRVIEFDYAFVAADVMTIQYRQTWALPMVNGNIQVPMEWEGMFIQAIRSYARGYQEEDVASLDQRMNALQVSGEMMNLKRLDGVAQGNRGAARGGMTEQWPAMPHYPRMRLY